MQNSQAKHITVNGHQFDSKLEASFYTMAIKAYGTSHVTVHPKLKLKFLPEVPEVLYTPDFLLEIPVHNTVTDSFIGFKLVYIEVKGLMSSKMRGNHELARNMHLMGATFGPSFIDEKFFILHNGIDETSPFKDFVNTHPLPLSSNELSAFFKLQFRP
jgi:hypothetical protein